MIGPIKPRNGQLTIASLRQNNLCEKQRPTGTNPKVNQELKMLREYINFPEHLSFSST